jgi:integrase
MTVALQAIDRRFESCPAHSSYSSVVSSSKLVLVPNNRKKTTELKPVSELTKHQLISLMTEVSQTRKKKYKRNKDVKYGNINKGFTESELKRFFNACKNKKASLAFRLMAYLGLRVGEVVRIKLDDIDFMHRKLRIDTEKARTGDLMYMHNKVHFLLKEWVRIHQNSILKCNGYLFFSDKRKEQHISKDWLRKKFRETAKTADLVQWYCLADDNKKRKLYRLSTHSLRHYFITKVYKQSKNPLHAQRLARHRAFKSTERYIRTEQEDIDTTIKAAFGEEGMQSNETEEFMKFYRMWKNMQNTS